jgi:hypothetical protein
VTPDGDLALTREQLTAWLVVSSPSTTQHHGHMPEITITGPDTATANWRVADPKGWKLRRSRYDRRDVDPVELDRV